MKRFDSRAKLGLLVWALLVSAVCAGEVRAQDRLLSCPVGARRVRIGRRVLPEGYFIGPVRDLCVPASCRSPDECAAGECRVVCICVHEDLAMRDPPQIFFLERTAHGLCDASGRCTRGEPLIEPVCVPPGTEGRLLSEGTEARSVPLDAAPIRHRPLPRTVPPTPTPARGCSAAIPVSPAPTPWLLTALAAWALIRRRRR